MPTRIAVDAMGGDAAPSVVVEGALRAVQQASSPFELLLFGPEARLYDELRRHKAVGLDALRVVDAPDVIGMAEPPASAVKSKQRSSIHLGLAAHRRGEADAFVSAGNTGAVMGASLFILGRQACVARPSVIGFFPTETSFCIVLDVGTNVDCKPEHLLQFARMGTLYARDVMKRENPVVALMNVGEEPGKGNDVVKAAYEMLAAAPDLNFRGNIEGRDVLEHAADVVVCDGFVGNIMLKFGESMATTFVRMVRSEMDRRGLSDERRAEQLDVLESVQKRFNYEEYGGAPLLGVNGNVLIGHGSSSARAIQRLIETAAEVAEQNVYGSITAMLGG
jgi:phosphate acyltransferase